MSPAHPNAAKLTAFYEAFARRDGAAMGALYRPDATFSDPAFPALRGPEVSGMWRMLCRNGKDLVVVASGIEADASQGRAHWEADYSFGSRRVHNVIDATFSFQDGLVVRHEDRFDFDRWALQALGPIGGRLPGVKAIVRWQAGRGLQSFLARERARSAAG